MPDPITTREAGYQPFVDADVYIGGEPYDVLDDVKMLRHVPCGEALFGDGSIAAHVCAPDEDEL